MCLCAFKYHITPLKQELFETALHDFLQKEEHPKLGELKKKGIAKIQVNLKQENKEKLEHETKLSLKYAMPYETTQAHHFPREAY